MKEIILCALKSTGLNSYQKAHSVSNSFVFPNHELAILVPNLAISRASVSQLKQAEQFLHNFIFYTFIFCITLPSFIHAKMLIVEKYHIQMLHSHYKLKWPMLKNLNVIQKMYSGNRSVLMHQELQWSYFVHCCLMKKIICTKWKEDQVTKEEYVI